MSTPSIPFDGPLRRLVIWGFGMEGRAALDWALAHEPRADVTIVDAAPDAIVLERPATIVGEADPAVDAAVDDADLIIRSAGVPPTKPALMRAAAKPGLVRTGMDIWFAAADPTRVIGVTGTKGKSGTARMIHGILREGGIAASLAGNVGRAMLATPLPENGEVAVVEISSYQACDLTVGPGAMGLTSLYRDHLTWHGGVEAYRAAKLRPFQAASCRIRVAPKAFAGVLTDKGLTAVEADRDLLPEHGPDAPELRDNAAVAMTLIRECGLLSADALQAAAARAFADGFSEPHRRFEVGGRKGALWIDDALATIPEATAAALRAYPAGRLVLILGGLDRGQDFTPLVEMIRTRGRVACVLTGGVAARLNENLIGVVPASERHLAASFRDAVALADRLADQADFILFSPSAASEPPETHVSRAAIFTATARNA